MTNLPEPDWLTLLECAKRAEQAFTTHEPSKVRAAVVAAFRDGKIPTRGRCRSYHGNDTPIKLGNYAWNRANVRWQENKFAIPSDNSFYRIHVFSDVVVHRKNLEKWINGAIPDSQREPQEPAENLTPKPSDKEEKPRSRSKRDKEAEVKLRNKIEGVHATARRIWKDPKKRPADKAMAKHLAENYGKKRGYKFSAIHQILIGTYRASRDLGIGRF